MEERRQSERHRTLKGARIVFHHGSSTLTCVIRNMSARGARLEIASSLGVPNEFVLHPSDGGPHRRCVVKWRREKSLGVIFVGADVLPGSPAAET